MIVLTIIIIILVAGGFGDFALRAWRNVIEKENGASIALAIYFTVNFLTMPNIVLFMLYPEFQWLNIVSLFNLICIFASLLYLRLKVFR